MDWQTTLEQRSLVLRDTSGQALLNVAFDRGGRYRVLAPDEDTIESLVDALEAVPGVSVLPTQGGLLGAMTVSANLSLALCYGVDADEAMVRDWDSTLTLALRVCGLSADRVASIGHEQPMNLDRMERWLVGFARYLLRPPELLVLDRAFAGLSRRQAKSVMALEAVYRQFHPFRPTLFVDLDSHGLPDMQDCCQLLELETNTCPS